MHVHVAQVTVDAIGTQEVVTDNFWVFAGQLFYISRYFMIVTTQFFGFQEHQVIDGHLMLNFSITSHCERVIPE